MRTDLLIRVARYAVLTVIALATGYLLALAGFIVAAASLPFPLAWAVGGYGGFVAGCGLAGGIYLLGRQAGRTVGWRDGYTQRGQEPSPGFEATAADVEAMWDQVDAALGTITAAVTEVSEAAGVSTPERAAGLRPAVPGGSRLVQRPGRHAVAENVVDGQRVDETDGAPV